MDTPSPQHLLRVPTPTHESLSFSNANPRDLKHWLDHLPKANLGETARQLYQGLIELNQLKLPVEARLQLLELFRPEVQFVCQHLERHFLNQSIVLDERPRKVANLCQALQNHLAIGYKLIVVREASRFARERAQVLAVAIQRAIRALGGPLIRASQLYCPVPESLWLELHQLYQLARQNGLNRLPIRDDLARHTRGLTIEQAYIIALMVGCSRCNQMRQNNIAKVAEALESWSPLVRLQDAVIPTSLFVVAPQLDGPPRYRSLFKGTDLPNGLGIDPQPLVAAIREHLENPPEARSQSLPMIDGIGVDLLQHLAGAWGDIAERTFQRTPGQGKLTVCIGMSALHYFLAGRKAFADLIKLPEVEAPSFKAEIDDAWSTAFDAQKVNDWQPGMPMEEIEYQPVNASEDGTASSIGVLEKQADDYPTFTLPIVNHSPGGYCLTWPREIPGQLQAGELLGIQDAPGQAWSIAIVRWVRQVRGGGTQMGIELIAPMAQPCGLQLLRKTEQSSQYLRALLLPAISAISRPATVITPRLPFQENARVQINTYGEERRAILGRRLTYTASFSQFEYRAQDTVAPPNDKPVTGPSSQVQAGEEDFDSLWKSL